MYVFEKIIMCFWKRFCTAGWLQNAFKAFWNQTLRCLITVLLCKEGFCGFNLLHQLLYVHLKWPLTCLIIKPTANKMISPSEEKPTSWGLMPHMTFYDVVNSLIYEMKSDLSVALSCSAVCFSWKRNLDSFGVFTALRCVTKDSIHTELCVWLCDFSSRKRKRKKKKLLTQLNVGLRLTPMFAVCLSLFLAHLIIPRQWSQ